MEYSAVQLIARNEARRKNPCIRVEP
jgi:hypothetical protein